MGEYLEILDENGNKTGKIKLRSEVHKDGDWHKTVHIWLFNKDNEVLLQRRCPEKDSFPNMLDLSAGGHIIAGDTSISGAIREVKEELGITIKEKDLIFIKTLKHSLNYKDDFINNQFEDIYIINKNIELDEITYQKEEISEVIFIAVDKLKQMVREKNQELVMREEEYEILFEYLDK